MLNTKSYKNCTLHIKEKYQTKSFCGNPQVCHPKREGNEKKMKKCLLCRYKHKQFGYSFLATKGFFNYVNFVNYFYIIVVIVQINIYCKRYMLFIYLFTNISSFKKAFGVACLILVIYGFDWFEICMS